MDRAADFDYLHLRAELARIDLFLRRAVLLWQRAGQDANDAFLGLYVSDTQALQLLNRPLCGSWSDAPSLTPEEAATFEASLEAAEQGIEKALRACQEAQYQSRLQVLAERFGLDRFALDVFLLCLAPMLDLRYEKLYGYLQDDVSLKRASCSLALGLLGREPASRYQLLEYFDEGAPLFKFELLKQAEAPGHYSAEALNKWLSVDEAVFTWLLGRYRPQADLDQLVQLSHPQETDADRLLAGAFVPFQLSGLHPPLLAFFGKDEEAQAAAARLVAVVNGRPLLCLDLTSTELHEGVAAEVVRKALRDALLTGAVAYVQGWDRSLVELVPPKAVLASVCAHPGPVIMAGQARWQAQGYRWRPIMWHAFPVPAAAQRKRLWAHFLPAGDVGRLEVSGPAEQFELTTGQIRDAVQTARDAGLQQSRELRDGDLFAAARMHSNPKLATLARKITPRYGWQDIVLPEDQLALLREMVATVRQRAQVLDVWGVGRKLVGSRGVTALFSGPPGTGKTMAAEVIAGELGLDLYKIDLSTVVSKYIGETEKNLERIFDEAASSNAILFFDEADALFGKRSEVRDSHDRYANIEISFLLQRMEAYDGVTMLATNLRANLDEAFTRRLQFAVDFPFPEEDYRLRIWHTLYPEDVPQAGDIDFDLLASRFRLAGGNIRNILVSAAYLAADDGQRITMEHLLHGTRRELQKMGRLVGEEDLLVC